MASCPTRQNATHTHTRARTHTRKHTHTNTPTNITNTQKHTRARTYLVEHAAQRVARRALYRRARRRARGHHAERMHSLRVAELGGAAVETLQAARVRSARGPAAVARGDLSQQCPEPQRERKKSDLRTLEHISSSRKRLRARCAAAKGSTARRARVASSRDAWVRRRVRHERSRRRVAAAPAARSYLHPRGVAPHEPLRLLLLEQRVAVPRTGGGSQTPCLFGRFFSTALRRGRRGLTDRFVVCRARVLSGSDVFRTRKVAALRSATPSVRPDHGVVAVTAARVVSNEERASAWPVQHAQLEVGAGLAVGGDRALERAPSNRRRAGAQAGRLALSLLVDSRRPPSVSTWRRPPHRQACSFFGLTPAA